MVTFKKDYELSFDGINTKIYKKGESYEANNPQEQKSFEIAVSLDIAEPTKKVQGEAIETKVDLASEKKTRKKKK